MIIFDRWGDEVFITEDLEKGWDGKVNDGRQTAVQDVYVYHVVIKDVFQKEHKVIGRVTLLR